MAFPAAWPPRVASNTRSIRFFTSGTATANFSDNAFLFIDGAGANTFTPVPNVPYGSNTPVADPLTPAGTGAATVASAMVGGPAPLIWSYAIRVFNDGNSTLEFSFDGTNVHGRLLTGEEMTYNKRHEAGIAVRSIGGTPTFRIEAW